ncbi:MAG: hypothetical protein E3J43_05625 [Candidatus Heimdallarchaeota archaeon]|nr:MAG: hypothetical protein E3J43_05625 [Candidatus Heimdallarchaeota archaeon]
MNGSEVGKLARNIAQLITKPKSNLIRPKSFIPLLWLTTRFSSFKEKITFQIAEQINRARLDSLKKLELEKSILKEEETEIIVEVKTKI